MWLLSLQGLVHRVNFSYSCFQLSFLESFIWERNRKVTSYGVNLESVGHRECLPGNRFSMFCTCYLVALMTCFLIGLMSLSLVLRAASYFKLVPFHIVVQPIFITAWVGHLGLDSLSGDILRFFIPECTKKFTRWR